MRNRVITVVGTMLMSNLQAMAQPTRSASAPTPAERRLGELIAAVESRSSTQIRDFVRLAFAPVVTRTGEDRLVWAYAALGDRSRGFVIDSILTTPTEAVALLRAKLTGLWEQLSVRVEAQPPYRINGPASLNIERPKHPLAAARASDAERVREIDRLSRTLARADVFSGVVLVAKGDSILYLASFGAADKKRGIPIDAGTRFPLASITKTFVTVAVAKLADEGKLSWEDTLGKFFPEFPLAAAREQVRVKHLVTHTAGLREFQKLPDRPDSLDDYVRTVTVAQHDSLLYEPGTRAVYSNTNFVLLGKIIELKSGRGFYEYVNEHIFQPARMDQTRFNLPGGVPARLPVAYDKRYTEDGVRFTSEEEDRRSPTSYPAPFSGAQSTARDLLRFARALRSGRLLARETVELLFAPKPEAGNWSYGFDILDEERGLVGHGGSWIGISNTIDMFTQTDYTVIILSNYTNGRSPLREALWSILP